MEVVTSSTSGRWADFFTENRRQGSLRWHFSFWKEGNQSRVILQSSLARSGGSGGQLLEQNSDVVIKNLLFSLLLFQSETIMCWSGCVMC